MWQKLAKALNYFVTNYLEKYLVSAALSALGLAGGFWGWIVGKVLSIAVSLGWKKANREIQSGARIADQTAVDHELNHKYQEDIKNDVPEDQLIKDELDILNGGHR